MIVRSTLNSVIEPSFYLQEKGSSIDKESIASIDSDRGLLFSLTEIKKLSQN